jgi:hypothetical protein
MAREVWLKVCGWIFGGIKSPLTIRRGAGPLLLVIKWGPRPAFLNRPKDAEKWKKIRFCGDGADSTKLLYNRLFHTVVADALNALNTYMHDGLMYEKSAWAVERKLQVFLFSLNPSPEFSLFPISQVLCRFFLLSNFFSGVETVRAQKAWHPSSHALGRDVLRNVAGLIDTRVARFVLVQYTKWPQNIPHCHKIHQIYIKYTKFT